MARSYIGIVTARGLELLVPETEHAAAFRLRRVRRAYAHPAFCCWAVLSLASAAHIRRTIERRLFLDALTALNADAVSLGTLLPADTDESSYVAR